MIWPKRNKERDRFYLLPGMGGRATRRKHRVFLVWSIVAGLTVSIIVAIVMILVNRR